MGNKFTSAITLATISHSQDNIFLLRVISRQSGNSKKERSPVVNLPTHFSRDHSLYKSWSYHLYSNLHIWSLELVLCFEFNLQNLVNFDVFRQWGFISFFKLSLDISLIQWMLRYILGHKMRESFKPPTVTILNVSQLLISGCVSWIAKYYWRLIWDAMTSVTSSYSNYRQIGHSASCIVSLRSFNLNLLMGNYTGDIAYPVKSILFQIKLRKNNQPSLCIQFIFHYSS